jgi:hypothetical protein
MASIHHLPQELLQHIVRTTLNDTSTKRTEGSRTHTIKAFSRTNRVLRAIAVPHLWRNAQISVAFDNLPQSLDAIESFAQPSHPVRQHARTLYLNVDSHQVSLNSDILSSLDTQLAAAITGMTGLESARIQLHTMYVFPETMRAILKLPALESLNIASRGCLKLPETRADKLTTLLVHNDAGSCQFDLSCFPILRDLSLSMEDSSSGQSWEEVCFPQQLWSTLKSLSLRGFTLDPDKPLSRLAESLHRYQGINALESISYHLAQNEQDATYAWQLLGQHTHLRSLSFTVPLLFDARYARRMVRAFPLLGMLELFAFSRAAAWQWPDPFEAYISAFAELKDLKVLAVNHNETSTVTPLPLTLPPGPLPMGLSLAAHTSPAGLIGNVLENQAVTVEADGTMVEDEAEPLVYGPLGSNFCSSVCAEDVEIQLNTARALFKAVPSLQQIKFEPGLTEQADWEMFAYKTSETLYVRPE